MEVEAKFTIPDPDTMRRLQSIVHLGSLAFASSNPTVHHVLDRYLDTPTQALYQSGYTCRIRQQEDKRLVTIKGLGKAQEAIHQRAESESELTPDAGDDPTSWPQGPARDLVCSLIQDHPLVQLFTVEQERHVRLLERKRRQVAQLSIDRVHIQAGGRLQILWVLEVEVMPDGTMAELQKLADRLIKTWGLQPAPLSKFHLGLSLLNQTGAEPGQESLSSAEQAELAYIAQHAPGLWIRNRAKLILSWDKGISVRETMAQIGASKSWAYDWLGRFRIERMGIFDTQTLKASEEQAIAVEKEDQAADSPAPEDSPPQQDQMAVAEMRAQPQAQIPSPKPEIELPELTSPGVAPDLPMNEAGRQVLLFYLVKMLRCEAGTREGADIEYVHNMRVATRRMRSALRVFGCYFKAKDIRSYADGLRRTARSLGELRDLDVLVEKTGQYLKALPSENAHDLDPLLETWRNQQQKARDRLVTYLNGGRYRDWTQAFLRFLTAPGAGTRKAKDSPPKPIQVRHVAPVLIYACWGQVLAFEPTLQTPSVATLHALRIRCKRLRYTLELFREVLGPQADQVVAQVVRLQDHLGNLNDACVANRLLSEFLFAGQGQTPKIAPGVAAYLAAKQRELHGLIESFPPLWAELNRPEMRQWLAEAILVL